MITTIFILTFACALPQCAAPAVSLPTTTFVSLETCERYQDRWMGFNRQKLPNGVSVVCTPKV